VAVGDNGTTAALSNKIADVGDGSGPLAIWVTGVYGIAIIATNGTAHFFESLAGVAPIFVPYAAGNARHMFSLYMTNTGDGIVFDGQGIGPITQDLWVVSDGTFTCNAGEIFITYDEVGQQ